jgi:hypothetical protein
LSNFYYLNISQIHCGEDINYAVLDDPYMPHANTKVITPLDHNKPIKEGTAYHKPLTCALFREAHEKCTIYGFNFFGDKIGTLNWLRENKEKIDIINISAKLVKNDQTDKIMDEIISFGIPVVCSAGNDSAQREGGLDYPGCREDTIAIGAWEEYKNSLEDYSDWGSLLDAVCFTNIYIANKNGKAVNYGGTSASAPMASVLLGTYAKLRKYWGLSKLTGKVAKLFIQYNCLDVMDKGKDIKSGYGLFRLPRVEELKYSPYDEILLQHNGDKNAAKNFIEKYWAMTVQEACVPGYFFRDISWR